MGQRRIQGQERGRVSSTTLKSFEGSSFVSRFLLRNALPGGLKRKKRCEEVGEDSEIYSFSVGGFFFFFRKGSLCSIDRFVCLFGWEFAIIRGLPVFRGGTSRERGVF